MIQLEYWTHEDKRREELEERLIVEFEKENPNIKVNRKTFSSIKMQEVVLTSFEAGKGPSLCTQPIENISALYDRGFISPISFSALSYTSLSDVYDVYQEKALDPVKYNSILYALPMEFSSWALFVNKDILKQEGIEEASYPKTLEKLYEQCKSAVRHEDGAIVNRLFDFRYPYYLNFMIPMVNELGGEIAEENGNLILYNEDAWLKVFSFFYSWGPYKDNLGSPTYINARNLFNKEKIGMCMSSLYQIKRMELENPSFYEGGNWTVIPFPHFEDSVSDLAPCSYLHYFVVNSELSRQETEASWALIGYFLDHEKEYLENVGIVVPKKSLFESDYFKAFPFSDVFLSELEKAPLLEHSLNSNSIFAFLSEAINDLMLSGVSVEKTLENFKIKLSRLND